MKQKKMITEMLRLLIEDVGGTNTEEIRGFTDEIKQRFIKLIEEVIDENDEEDDEGRTYLPKIWDYDEFVNQYVEDIPNVYDEPVPLDLELIYYNHQGGYQRATLYSPEEGWWSYDYDWNLIYNGNTILSGKYKKEVG
jgi:hypothetical protein